MILILLIVLLEPITHTLASSSRSQYNWTELGNCKPKDRSEESVARREAERAKLSDHEVLARLILSESLSTGFWKKKCEATSSRALMEAIGWGIMNRVQKRSAKKSSSPFYDVIFQKNQFRTSFSGRKENPFAKAFLCPMKAQDYLNAASLETSSDQQFPTILDEAQEVALNLLSHYAKNGIPERFRGISHFFYPNSEFFGEIRPAWAKNKNPNKNTGYVEIFVFQTPCVEFYRLNSALPNDRTVARN